MKKLVVLALIVWGVGPTLKRKAIERWWPDETKEARDRRDEGYRHFLERDRQRVERMNADQAQASRDQARQRAMQSIDRTHGAQPQAASQPGAGLEREQQPAGGMSASNEQATKRLFNQGDCVAAQSNLVAISLVEKAPSAYELQKGGKVATEAEKTAVRAESEKYIKENCR